MRVYLNIWIYEFKRAIKNDACSNGIASKVIWTIEEAIDFFREKKKKEYFS